MMLPWNNQPDDVRSATSLSLFRNKLKTYLFAKPSTHPRLFLTSLVFLHGPDPCCVSGQLIMDHYFSVRPILVELVLDID